MPLPSALTAAKRTKYGTPATTAPACAMRLTEVAKLERRLADRETALRHAQAEAGERAADVRALFADEEARHAEAMRALQVRAYLAPYIASI